MNCLLYTPCFDPTCTAKHTDGMMTRDELPNGHDRQDPSTECLSKSKTIQSNEQSGCHKWMTTGHSVAHYSQKWNVDAVQCCR